MTLPRESAFDFEAAEHELSTTIPDLTLRERAAMAFTVYLAEREHFLLAAAAEVLHEKLGISLREAKEPKVEVSPNGYGRVEVVIDNLLFQVEVAQVAGEDDYRLSMKGPQRTMDLVTSLLDVGRKLARDPCYAVKPEVDGRGAE